MKNPAKKFREKKHPPIETDADRQAPGEKWSGWFVIVMASIGVGVCLYLYSLHLELLTGEIKGALLCGAREGYDCHSVASSPYSSIFRLPLAVLGAIFYIALALLGFGGVIFRRDSGRAYIRWGFLLAAAGLLVDLYLAYTMLFIIDAVCWPCMATYAINLAIFIVLAGLLWRKPGPKIPLLSIFPRKVGNQGIQMYYRNMIKGILIVGILLTSVAFASGSIFISKLVTGNDLQRIEKMKKTLSRQRPRVINVKNRPAMGDDSAEITVVEFSDFRCPYCSKASRYLKLSESATRGTARFIFLHFPLDKSCNRRISSNIHPGACLLAEGAACAHEQNRFWGFHDAAFEFKGKISRSVVMNIASHVGMDLRAFEACLDSGRGLRVVSEDIQTAAKLGVSGTPTLFINGRRLGGVPKSWMLNEILKSIKKNPGG
jgi:protein-disulfide isomerase/uncharacterized membrane protein